MGGGAIAIAREAAAFAFKYCQPSHEAMRKDFAFEQGINIVA
jgi:hypothetical protein